MVSDGGGWTVFQRRFNGSVDFYRNFTDYENGFGFVDGEYWLGLKYIHEIASQGGNQLRIDIVRSDGSTGYDVYDNSSIESGPNYTIHVGSRLRFSGIFEGYSLKQGNGYASSPDGHSFSTYDHDTDSDRGNCASDFHGGWWYNSCYIFNPNGLYQPGSRNNSEHMAYAGEEGLKATTLMFKSI
ncbi:hypothetical protein DPMN_178728 [Dreissena polymorpha]|uniref:Fibrinogen C-terminal domain-containing protein n=1 Tax=Dreissena polymorpha TaxID=45954 RepID=A0A9D4IMW4_DREPO|nr:hypothetical protein DPMN_178728 [Dreissena polymorpha]